MDDEAKQEILRLHERGLGMRRIAPRLRVSRKTIRKVLAEAGRLPASPQDAPSARPRPASKLDRWKDHVRELAAKGLGSPRILRELQTQGYDGGRTILVEYLREVRPPKPPKCFRRFETAPAEEAQADWSPYRVELGGRKRTVHAFALVLAYSRRLHVRFYLNERIETLLYAIEQALLDMRGVARRLVLDNMTTVTHGRVNRRPVFHDRFLALARHYMFEPFVCRPYDPNRKGKIERPFHYLEQDFLAGRAFASLADLNVELQCWLREVANVRVHGTTRRVPEEVWRDDEQPLLIRLPERPFGAYHQEVRPVYPDGFLSFDGSRYSAPAHLAGAQVTVRATPDELEIIDALGSRVATHPIAAESGAIVADARHQPPRERTSPRALEDDLLRRFPGSAAFLAGLRRRQRSFTHLHLAKLRRLATGVSEEQLLAAIQRAAQIRGFSAHTVARLLDYDRGDASEPPAPLNAQAVLGAIDDDDDPPSLADYRELDAQEADDAA